MSAKLTQTGRYEFSPIIDRKPLKLPNGARVAIVPYINIEHFPEDIPGTALVPGTAKFTPDTLNYGWCDYGNRVGLWRMMDRYDYRGTVCMNSDIIREYLHIIEEGEKPARPRDQGLAGSFPVRGLQYSGRHPCRPRGRISMRFYCRRSAVQFQGEERQADFGNVSGRTERYPGDHEYRRQWRAVRRHDHRPVRCAVLGGQAQPVHHADLPAHVSDRPAIPRQASRAGVQVHGLRTSPDKSGKVGDMWSIGVTLN